MIDGQAATASPAGNIETMPTARLEALRADCEAAGDWPRMERCEAELERRDYDASDPASPQNTRED